MFGNTIVFVKIPVFVKAHGFFRPARAVEHASDWAVIWKIDLLFPHWRRSSVEVHQPCHQFARPVDPVAPFGVTSGAVRNGAKCRVNVPDDNSVHFVGTDCELGGTPLGCKDVRKSVRPARWGIPSWRTAMVYPWGRLDSSKEYASAEAGCAFDVRNVSVPLQ